MLGWFMESMLLFYVQVLGVQVLGQHSYTKAHTFPNLPQVLRMFSAQSATFKDLLREQRRTYDNALMTVMNELLVALEESEVRVCLATKGPVLRIAANINIF